METPPQLALGVSDCVEVLLQPRLSGARICHQNAERMTEGLTSLTIKTETAPLLMPNIFVRDLSPDVMKCDAYVLEELCINVVCQVARPCPRDRRAHDEGAYSMCTLAWLRTRSLPLL